jgi:hypothetical protein
MPEKKRAKLSKTVEKRVFQQGNSQCAFCPESEIASLQIHHIDENPANSVVENLLLVCANCHTKITGGVISEADVRLKKRELERINPKPNAKPATVSVNISDSQFRGDIAHTINKFTTPRTPRVAYPVGSLGSNLSQKGYVDYLITRYYEFRKADTSFGRRVGFSYAELHKTIQKEFGHRTFYMPEGFFQRLVDFLKMRIDRTILGKRNISRHTPNYHSYEKHFEEYNS